MRRACFVTPAGLALLAFGGAVSAEEYARSYSVSGRTEVYVRADDGSVRVLPSDAAKVEFRVTYEGYTLDDDLTLESRQEAGRVELVERIKPRKRRRHGFRQRVEIEVRAPRESDLRIETGDGSVNVSSMNGLVQVRTGDGAVDVSEVSGKVDLRSGDGAIRAERVKGDLRVRTVDGAIEGIDLDGRCEAFTGDGTVRIAGRFDEINIASGDGSVGVRVAKGSVVSFPWNIRTGDGSVEVAIPADLEADLDVATNDGGISIKAPVTVQGDVGSRRVRGTLNGGGPELHIRSSDGSVRIEGS